MPLTEASKEMTPEDQGRLQKSETSLEALTIEALEEHNMKISTGPLELRQFACGECHVSWWRTVCKTNPVSRCKGEKCGQQRYDALPRLLEFGIGRCVCPNEECDFESFVRCEANSTVNCRKCKTECKPYIHPKWKKKEKKREKKTQLDSDVPVEAARNNCHKKKKREIFNASEIHELTGGTVSTFLTQVDFESIAEEVDLEYNSWTSDDSDDSSSNDDDGDEKVGARKFECICGNEYTVICRKIDTAPCYECERVNSPLYLKPLRNIQKKAAHNCSRCNGAGNCPNLGEAEMIPHLECPTESQSEWSLKVMISQD